VSPGHIDLNSGARRDRAAAARARRQRVARAVARFQAGLEREASFRLLYDSYFRPLQRFFARKGLPPEECLDLTQETFLGIYKGLATYRERSRFEAWLYRLATNAYRKRLRARRAAKRAAHEVALDDVASAPGAPASPAAQPGGLIDAERRTALQRVVRELPPQMRKCLTLRLYHQLTYRQIAIVMKLKIDTVKAHLHQARSRLHRALKDEALDAVAIEETD